VMMTIFKKKGNVFFLKDGKKI